MARPKNPKLNVVRLRKLRKAKGWSVNVLAREAERVGGGPTFAASSVQAWEAGYHGPDRARLEALARALGVPPETLAAKSPPLLER